MLWSKQKLLLAALLTLSVAGLIDATYLSYKTISGGSVVCNLLNGCSVVLNSPWATIFGIPTAIYGAGYYGVLTLFAGAYLYWRDHLMLQLVTVISTVGFLFTVWLVYLQLFRLEAVCEYCMLSAALTTLIAVSAWIRVSQKGWRGK